MPPSGKVLIVEDDDSTRLLLQAVVARNHLEPIVARDGRSAQALLAVSVYDAILLDLRLPEISGIDILQGLDGDVRKRVVIVTAVPRDQWHAYAANVWGVIQKPFDIADLEETLQQCLAAHVPGDENAGDRPAERVPDRRP